MADQQPDVGGSGSAFAEPDSVAAAGLGDPVRLATFLHEVRSSVGGLVLRAGAIAERVDQLSPDELRDELERLAERGEQIRLLLRRSLDDSARPSDRAGHRPVQVADRIRRIVEEREWSDDHRVELRAADDLAVVTDVVSLDQILANLLDNARIHGGSHVEVRAESGDGTLILHVLDDGPGLTRPAEELRRPFERLAPDRPGWGLGLAVVDDLVTSLGGEVTYGPNHPSGAWFTVTLPAD